VLFIAFYDIIVSTTTTTTTTTTTIIANNLINHDNNGIIIIIIIIIDYGVILAYWHTMACIPHGCCRLHDIPIHLTPPLGDPLVSEGYVLPIIYNHTVEMFIVLTSQRSIDFMSSLTKQFHSPGTLMPRPTTSAPIKREFKSFFSRLRKTTK
jgi:hypothetical protein